MTTAEPLDWHDYGIDLELITRGKVAFVVPTIPESAPRDVREGIARRRILYLESRCPCGATWTPPTPLERFTHDVVSHETVSHARHCQASGKRIERALRKWRGAA